MNEFPEIAILLKTWQGPRELEIGQSRLDALAKTIPALREHLIYPNYSWHIADDGSDAWYQDEVQSHFEKDGYTFSDTHANGNPGLNLNLGMRVVLGRADIVLHWSDDIVLHRDYDLRPYVKLLCECPEYGRVRLRPAHPSITDEEVHLHGRLWHKVVQARICVDTALVLEHRRFWDYYGPYPEGIRLDIMQLEMTWRYTRANGPRVVVPDEMWTAPAPSCLGPTTWEWQNRGAHERDSKWWFRSYSARSVSRSVSGAQGAQDATSGSQEGRVVVLGGTS